MNKLLFYVNCDMIKFFVAFEKYFSEAQSSEQLQGGITMTISNQQKIGTHFKKENIFLATVTTSNVDTKEMLKSKMAGMDSKVSEDLMALFVDKSLISSEQFDIFYKDDTGYTRFVEEGLETFAGDNSDGKGIVRNVVSIWDYYSEEQVIECMLNNEFMAICVLDMAPLYKYNEDYNKV